MKKIIIIMLCLSGYALAISPFTYKWTIRLTGDTATVAKWRANNDSVLNWSSKVCDTFNKVTPRWNWFSSVDSLFRKMRIDTIRGNTDIDSISGLNVIRGNPDVDSLSGLNVIRGNPNIDSISGLSAVGGNPVFSGTASVDSLYSTKGIKAPIFYGSMAGISISLDSIHARVATVDTLSFNDAAIDTSCLCSLFVGTTYKASSLSRIIKQGKIVTIYFNSLASSEVSVDFTTFLHIPEKFWAYSNVELPVTIQSNTVNSIGYLSIPETSHPYLKLENGNNLGSGTSGIVGCSVTYIGK